LFIPPFVIILRRVCGRTDPIYASFNSNEKRGKEWVRGEEAERRAVQGLGLHLHVPEPD
jgi:hypothetical protein